MKSRKLGFATLLVSALVLGGCGTPQAVKSLSTEQVKAMQSFDSHLRNYFAAIEQLVSQQIDAANENLDELTDDILRLHRRLAAKNLAQGNSPTTANSDALVNLTNAHKKQIDMTHELKLKLASRKSSLEAAHQRFLVSYQTLLAAQGKLDQFLQLERADERVFNELLSAVGVSQEQFGKAVDTVVEVTKGLGDTVAKIKALTSG